MSWKLLVPTFALAIITCIQTGCDDSASGARSDNGSSSPSTSAPQRFFERITSPRPSIVGKWEASGGNTVEFFPDGTLIDAGYLNTSNGTYVLLGNGRMKTDIEGVFWGNTVTTWKYTLQGNNLTLTTEGDVGISFEFKRIK